MDLRAASIDYEQLEALRTLIYDYLSKKCSDETDASSLTFDLEDVRNRITPPTVPANERPKHRLPDLFLRRLILSIKGNEPLEGALKYFIEAFTFRKEFNLVRTSLEDVIPIEFYKVAPFLCDGVDRNGNQLFIIRVKYYRKLAQFDTLIKQGFMYLLEQFDLQYEKGDFAGATVIIDIQGFDWWTNYNFELVRFVFNGFYHYRGIVKSILIHKFPWALGWMLRLVESWINAIRGYQHKTLHQIDETNIDEYIDEDQRPDFLYGTRAPFKPPIPSTAVFIDEMLARSRGKISEKNATVITKYVHELVRLVEEESCDGGNSEEENGGDKANKSSQGCCGDSNNNNTNNSDETLNTYKV